MTVASVGYKTVSHYCGYKRNKDAKSTPGSKIFSGIKWVQITINQHASWSSWLSIYYRYNDESMSCYLLYFRRKKQNKTKIFLSLTGFQKLWSRLPIQDYYNYWKQERIRKCLLGLINIQMFIKFTFVLKYGVK